MINAIIEAISISLNAEFGDKYKIHREANRQGLEKPCFFIQCINPTEKLFFGKRYYRQNQFCVQYFPEDELHGNQECCAIAERLFSCLEYIDVGGDPVMGTGMRYEVDEEIMRFFVDYDLFVYKAGEPVSVMGEVLEEISVKGR